jgi:TonB family protein
MQVAWELERWPAPRGAAEPDPVPAFPEGQLRLVFDDSASTPVAPWSDHVEPAAERAGEIHDASVVATLRQALARRVEQPSEPAADATPPAAAPAPAKPARVLAPTFARKPAEAAAARRPPLRGVTTAAVAAVVIAAVGFPVLTKLRAGAPSEPAGVVAEPPAPAAPRPAVAETAAMAGATAAAKPEPRTPAVEPPRSANPRPMRPNARSGARTRTRTPQIELPAPRPPEAAPSPAAVVVTEPAVEAPPPPPAREPVAPAGPFFEMRDVHVPPQIVARVEPVVPASVAGPVNEIVVVRVLVSQAGQPSMARLLRASKTGPAIDNAVIQAVHQWTFVPAQRRGTPVSCWYHVGVSVGGH